MKLYACDLLETFPALCVLSDVETERTLREQKLIDVGWWGFYNIVVTLTWRGIFFQHERVTLSHCEIT